MLRPYQRDCLKHCLADYRLGIRRQLWVMPTASGKTEVVSRLPDLLKQVPGEQGMFLVNRDDLVGQAARTFRRNNPSLRIDTERGEEYADPLADVIIASVQSLGKKDGVAKRTQRFNPKTFRWIVVDEAHFCISSQFINILKYFRVFKGDEHCDDHPLLVGISATPARTDGVGLEAVFDKISYEIPIKDLIESGPTVDGQLYSYLASPKAYRVSTTFDLSMVRTRNKDFVEADLSHALDTPDRNSLILDKYLEYGEGFPAIAFTVNVAHAHSLAKMFSDNGVKAEPISGHTPRKERDR